jgi:hypothetical protein
MELVLTPSTVNESNPVSIHKIIDDELVLMPGDKATVSILVFPRRTGLQTLKGFKAFDKQLKGDREHESKGYAFSFPKFTIVDS